MMEAADLRDSDDMIPVVGWLRRSAL